MMERGDTYLEAPGGPLQLWLPETRIERLSLAARIKRYATVTPFEALVLAVLARHEQEHGEGDPATHRAIRVMLEAVVARTIADRAAQGEHVTQDDILAEIFAEARYHEDDNWEEMRAAEEAFAERDREALRRAAAAGRLH